MGNAATATAVVGGDGATTDINSSASASLTNASDATTVESGVTSDQQQSFTTFEDLFSKSILNEEQQQTFIKELSTKIFSCFDTINYDFI